MNKQLAPLLFRLAMFLSIATATLAVETSTVKDGNESGSNETAAPLRDSKNLKEEELLAAILSRLDRLEARVASMESEQRNQLAGLRSGVQTAFNQIGEQIGEMNESIARLKKITKPLTAPLSEKPAQP